MLRPEPPDNGEGERVVLLPGLLGPRLKPSGRENLGDEPDGDDDRGALKEGEANDGDDRENDGVDLEREEGGEKDLTLGDERLKLGVCEGAERMLGPRSGERLGPPPPPPPPRE